jgi:hypothetical protein
MFLKLYHSQVVFTQISCLHKQALQDQNKGLPTVPNLPSNDEIARFDNTCNPWGWGEQVSNVQNTEYRTRNTEYRMQIKLLMHLFFLWGLDLMI